MGVVCAQFAACPVDIPIAELKEPFISVIWASGNHFNALRRNPSDSVQAQLWPHPRYDLRNELLGVERKGAEGECDEHWWSNRLVVFSKLAWRRISIQEPGITDLSEEDKNAMKQVVVGVDGCTQDLYEAEAAGEEYYAKKHKQEVDDEEMARNLSAQYNAPLTRRLAPAVINRVSMSVSSTSSSLSSSSSSSLRRGNGLVSSRRLFPSIV